MISTRIICICLHLLVPMSLDAAVATSTIRLPPLADRPEFRVAFERATSTAWSDAARSGYVAYPTGRAYPKGTILDYNDADAVAGLLSKQQEGILLTIIEEKILNRVTPMVVAFWIERRTRFLNRDEVRGAVTRGEFDFLIPKTPLLGYDLFDKHGLQGWILPSNLGSLCPSFGMDLSPGGVQLDPMPVQFEAVMMPPWETARHAEIESLLNHHGTFLTPRGLHEGTHGAYYTGLGTQFGHTAHRWTHGQYVLTLNMMKPDGKLLDAFMACTPSDLRLDDIPSREQAGPAMLRRGVERLRRADVPLVDDECMIRTDPLRPQGCFTDGVRSLQHLKDLWPVTFGYLKRHAALRKQFLDTQGEVWSWQGYLDGVTALRAETLAAVEAYAAEVDRRGMVYIPKMSRVPYESYEVGKEPPTWELGPEKP